ncbi:MAG: hypothetical protein IJO62_03690 [Clostridia bacterium]|nr:hypothetical protein [Clostridia bacterium]
MLDKILKTLVVSIIFGASVFTVGYFFLDSRLSEKEVSENVNSVPYYEATPQNTCLLMRFCEDEVVLNLDFNEKIISIAFINESPERYGYYVDYTLNCDYNTVGYFVDSIGGIELGDFRHTGVQITEILEYTNVSDSQKREIAEKIIQGIAKAGFTKESLLYIINTSETDLKFNQCFSWVDFIPELCKFPRFVN